MWKMYTKKQQQKNHSNNKNFTSNLDFFKWPEQALTKIKNHLKMSIFYFKETCCCGKFE